MCVSLSCSWTLCETRIRVPVCRFQPADQVFGSGFRPALAPPSDQDSAMVQRVAVIGAGSSGLVCIKVCLEEGLQPVCFESSDDIGGLWRFKESPETQRASIYRSLVVNTSKELMCFSDFPMPPSFPNYPHNSQLLQYYRLYAEHFNLLRHIHFQTSVISVSQRTEFSVSGQWDVVTVDRDGVKQRQVFDAVLVCSGYESFSGRCIHSWEYKDADACRGKRVVVVGIGNSAGDIAVEISRSAQKTFLSTRQGAWVIGRMSSHGLPLDMMAITRLNNVVMKLLPKTLLNWAFERSLNQRYDHRLYGLQPRHRALDRRPLINDDLPCRILQGALVMKPNLRAFRGSVVEFEDGSMEEDIHTLVFCTGYKGTFSFLPAALTEGSQGEFTLYKRVFPPSLSKPTLAIMGLFQTKGPIMPTVELQARWAVKVFTGVRRLPPEEKMLEVIECERRRNMRSYPNPRQAALQVDFISYLDFMAEEVGVRPNLLTLLLKDPLLWVKVFFGPVTPYQYRLTGPGHWAGARQAILTQWERVRHPFRTRTGAAADAGRWWTGIWCPCLLLLAGSLVVTRLLFLQGTDQMLERVKILLRNSCSTG